MHQHSLKPNKLWVIAATQREKAFVKRNRAMINRYNRHTKELPVLEIGQDVSIQETNQNRRWLRFGTIVDQDSRKYTIRVHGSGRVVTRNRRFLKPIEIPSQSPDIIVHTTSSQHSDGNNYPRTSSCQSQNNAPEVDDTSLQTILPNQAMPAQAETSDNSQEQINTRNLPRMLTCLYPHNKPGLTEQ